MQISNRFGSAVGASSFLCRQAPRYAGCRTCAQQQQTLQLGKPNSPFKRTRKAALESEQWQGGQLRREFSAAPPQQGPKKEVTAMDPSALAVGEINPGAGASVTASTPPSIPNLPAPGGITAFEGLLIFAPVILYGLFSVYRSKVNERAKLSDFLFIAAAGVVVANLISIVFFRRRLY